MSAFGLHCSFPFFFFFLNFVSNLCYLVFFMFSCKMPEILSETRQGVIKPCDTTAEGT